MKNLRKSDQVYELISQKIKTGEFPLGSRLAPEKELAKQIGISCRTLRTALARLEDNQLIVRLRKQGTFIAGGENPSGKIEFPPIPKSPTVQRNFQHKILVIYKEGASNSSIRIVRQVEKYAATLKVDTVEVSLDFLENGKWENRVAWLKKQYFSAVIIPFHGIGVDSVLLDLPNILHVPVVFPFAMEVLTAYDKFFLLHAMTKTAVFRALYYLQKKGHRKIGVIGTRLKETNSSFLHYVLPHELKFLCTDGFPIDEYVEEETKEQTCAAVDRLLEKEKDLTAIFCSNNFMAVTVIEYLQELGKKVPDDISVMGYGFTATGENINPALTSISLFIEERVKRTVDFILKGDYRQEIFQTPTPQVVEYESVKNLNKK